MAKVKAANARNQAIAARMIGKTTTTIQRWLNDGTISLYAAGINRKELIAAASRKIEPIKRAGAGNFRR